MKRMPWLAMAVTVALPMWSAAAVTLPPDIDVFGPLLDLRIRTEGIDRALDHSSAHVAATLLLTPASPYSEPNPSPDFTNLLAWPRLVATLGPSPPTPAKALDVLRWDMGVTRSRPGIDVTLPDKHGFRDDFVAAQAIKADVDADVFWQSLDLAGGRYSTLAAVYAVGLQILKRQMEANDPSRYAVLAIREDIYRRVMGTNDPTTIPDGDWRYLADIVEYRMSGWRPGGRAASGARQLPVAYRVARVAAAYRDIHGYVSRGPCLPDGTPRPGTAGTQADDDDRPLCFVAATDRAVHRWYLDERDFQLSGRLPNQHVHDTLEKLMKLAAPVMLLMDMAAFVESAEAFVADGLLGREAITDGDMEVARERLYRRVCTGDEG